MSEIPDIRAKVRPIRPFLESPSVNEIQINGPGRVFLLEKGSRIARQELVPELTYESLSQLSRVAGFWSGRQSVERETPLLSCKLPANLEDGIPDSERGSYRLQVVGPPAVEEGLIAMTIRKPGVLEMTLDKYQQDGAFEHVNEGWEPESDSSDERIGNLYVDKKWPDFLTAIVKARKNILCSAATYVGKTTVLNMMLTHVGHDERVITIEDSKELKVLQPNNVRLFYSRGDQGQAKVGPSDLLIAILRLTPDRPIMGEVRGPEADTYLEMLNSGHNGSITTIHADSPDLAWERLAKLAQNAGGNRTIAEIITFAKKLIDVVLQWRMTRGGKRYLSHVWYAGVSA